MDRRHFLTWLSVGAAAAAAGACSDPAVQRRSSPAPLPGRDEFPLPGGGSPATAPSPVPVPPPVPGPPVVLSHSLTTTRRIALTIDDGFDAETVSAYVAFAQDSGIALTFSPNGLYRHVWEPHARVLRPLIEAGQVQIGNHTYDHKDLTRLTDGQVREQVERNEAWIERTFGTTGRPYLRPPYGFHDERTDVLAGDLGYTRILMWNASFGDSRLLTPQVLMAQARRYLVPGAVVLGHANHPTVTHLYEQILELLHERDLTPVTLDTMFGTRRVTGT